MGSDDEGLALVVWRFLLRFTKTIVGCVAVAVAVETKERIKRLSG
jgi:hypothetical protein